VAEEAKLILADTLTAPNRAVDNYPLPELIPSQEISPPCDLPVPDSVHRVMCRDVDPTLPDLVLVDN
jgi:hypothetical protein